MRDYTDLAAGGPLQLPYRGKLYTVPPLSIELGLRLHGKGTTQDEATAALTAATLDETYRAVLGSAFDEMLADNVPYSFVERCYVTAFTDITRGRVIAELVWEVGHDPKATEAWVRSTARIANDTAGAGSGTNISGSGKSTNTAARAAKRRRPKAAPGK